MKHKRSFLVRGLVIAAFAAIGLAFLVGRTPMQNRTSASASGPTPGVSGASGEGSCVVCHSDFAVNSGTGNITISGVPKNYLPGQPISVTVRVDQVAATIYGFQMTTIDPIGAFRGSYTYPVVVPQPLQIVTGIVQNQERKYIEHTQDGTVPLQFDWHSWTFTFNAPSPRVGKLRFYAAGNAANGDKDTPGDYIYTTSVASLSGSAIANYDDDTQSDLSVFRPSNGTWYIFTSGTQQSQEHIFGLGDDIITPGDYDGDSKTDLAVWRPSNATWYFDKSGKTVGEVQFGQAGDIPVAADYDGDLKTDIAVWRPSNGTWYVLRSSDSVVVSQPLGRRGDKPVPADYDGDARAEFAVYRPSMAVWYMISSGDGSIRAAKFGLRGDVPLQSDYDGDGRCDLAVYRPSTSGWYVHTAAQTQMASVVGSPGDIPAPADFDGDGKTDFAAFRNGTWNILGTDSGTILQFDFGTTGDIPVSRGYIPQ